MTEDRVFTKCAWRLIPFAMLLFIVNYVDRTNVGFAALTMNKDLGFSPAMIRNIQRRAPIRCRMKLAGTWKKK